MLSSLIRVTVLASHTVTFIVKLLIMISDITNAYNITKSTLLLVGTDAEIFQGGWLLVLSYAKAWWVAKDQMEVVG